MSDVAELKRRNTRKAAVLQVGGFRPTLAALASNFGRTPVAAAGEGWPTSGGRQMLFVCQLNLAEAPVVPPLLADLQLLTLFVDSAARGLPEESGSDWQLRAYRSLIGLVPLAPPAEAPKVKKGFECVWQEVEDHPNHDDPDRVSVPGTRWPRSGFDNVTRTKIGGYASTIQAEPWWELKDHPARPKFCLQINSEEKAGVFWGDAGTLLIARGTAPGCEERWFLDWQCF